MRTTIIALAGMLVIISAYPAAGQSANADMGLHSRFTHLNGTVKFTQDKGTLQLEAGIGGLDNKQNYDLFVLTSACKVTAPFTSTPEDVQPQAAQNKTAAQQAAKSGTKVLTIKSGTGGKTTGSTKEITYADAMGKGLLLVQGQNPIECADIKEARSQPTPPPPPPPAK